MHQVKQEILLGLEEETIHLASLEVALELPKEVALKEGQKENNPS